MEVIDGSEQVGDGKSQEIFAKFRACWHRVAEHSDGSMRGQPIALQLRQ